MTSEILSASREWLKSRRKSLLTGFDADKLRELNRIDRVLERQASDDMAFPQYQQTCQESNDITEPEAPAPSEGEVAGKRYVSDIALEYFADEQPHLVNDIAAQMAKEHGGSEANYKSVVYKLANEGWLEKVAKGTFVKI